MPIDNNLLERDIRVFATGRKSWLFCDTVDGALASAVTYSLMLTCRACGVEPLAWLRHVLTELPQRELRQANEILRKASAYFAQAERARYFGRPFKR